MAELVFAVAIVGLVAVVAIVFGRTIKLEATKQSVRVEAQHPVEGETETAILHPESSARKTTQGSNRKPKR